MPLEIAYLLSAVGLYGFMIAMQAVGAVFSRKTTMKELLGPRDALPANGLTPFHGRTKRAQANMTEGMILFVPTVLAGAYLDAFTATTALGAALFFYGRLAFAPLYWFGVPVLRTVAWAVSLIGILMVFWGVVT